MPFMSKSLICFHNGAIAVATQIDPLVDLDIVLHDLSLDRHRPVLVVIGGASKLSQEDFDRVHQLFVQVLAPLAQKWQAAVIDGGTDTGVMRLMGEARLAVGADFPLIGVVPIGLATLPEQSAPAADAAPLEPNHTHFVFVPGSNWGDESEWIANLASTLADTAPSVTVLVNGGEITWKDASQSVQAERSILVIAGSGRTADIIAAALKGQVTDTRAIALVSSGLVQAIDLSSDPGTLTESIDKIFVAVK
jgi:hypothetical protein